MLIQTIKVEYRRGDDPCPYIKENGLFPTDPSYKKFVGSDKRTFVVANTANAGDRVYVTDNPDNTRGDGFGGATLTFNIDDGTKFEIHGGWKISPESLFQYTGYDVRMLCATKFTAGKVLNQAAMKLEEVVYTEPWTIGYAERGPLKLQCLANRMKVRLNGISEGVGGTFTCSACPVNVIDGKQVITPNLDSLLTGFKKLIKSNINLSYDFDDLKNGLGYTTWADRHSNELLSFSKEEAILFVDSIAADLRETDSPQSQQSDNYGDYNSSKNSRRVSAKKLESRVFSGSRDVSGSTATKSWTFVDTPCGVCLSADCLITGQPVDKRFIDERCVHHDDGEGV